MLSVLTCLAEQHDATLVAIAVSICIFSVSAGLELDRRSWRAKRRSSALAWLAGSALVLGLGIWSTHFVAMLAYDPGLPFAFDDTRTITSSLVAIGGMAAALALGLAWSGTPARLASGFLAGLSIAAMHYIGSSAIEIAATLHWDPQLVLASLLLSAAVGMAAFWFNGRPAASAQVAAVVCLILAIVLLHFTAMGAMTFTPDPAALAPEGEISRGLLVLFTAAGIVVIILIALVATIIDHQLRRRGAGEAKRREAIAAASFEGLVVLAGNIILEANDRAAAIAGQRRDTLMGKPLDSLIPDAHQAVLARSLSLRDGEPVEIELLQPDGRRTPIEILARGIELDGSERTLIAIRDVSDRKRDQERIRELADLDSLTRLPNRTLFMDRLHRAVATAKRNGDNVGLMLLDVRGFSGLNDTIGHDAADRLLIEVAQRLKSAVRETDTVARFYGDDFAIVLDGGQQPRGLSELGSKLNELFAAPFETAGRAITVRLSAGASIFPFDAQDADQLLSRAQIALAQGAGEDADTVRFYESGLDAAVKARRGLERDLARAIEAQEFVLHYQPKTCLRTGVIQGFEALVRWNHPTRGLVSPGEFIPVAEESGLILQLGSWALRRACLDAAAWPAPLHVAVNVSPIQIAHSGLAGVVRAALAESGLEPARLSIEITESSLLTDVKRSVDLLNELKQLGVVLELDDFGTGYSSLSYLGRFPFDVLKIDRSFVAGIDYRTDALAIVRAILAMSRSLNLKVVAEGAETLSELERLCAEGCDAVQGFIISRPLPLEHVPDFLARHLSTLGRVIARERDGGMQDGELPQLRRRSA